MAIRFVAFDVETPNRKNDRISSIGVSVIDEEGRIETKEYLVNPECDFDAFNTALTGITPDLVKEAPIFPVVWEQISDLFSSATLVAHNAAFDLSVLRKTLAGYDLPFPKLKYICTLRMAQTVLPHEEQYRLSVLCARYGISLEAHRAGSDSEACARLLNEFVRSGLDTAPYLSCCEPDTDKHRSGGWANCRREPSAVSRSLQQLNEILLDISRDGMLDEDELAFLIDWMNENEELKGNFPYDRIYGKLNEVLADGVVSPEEREELLCLFDAAKDPISGVSAPRVGFDPNGKSVCLTGDFDYGKKSDVESFLSSVGANVVPSVTKKTDLLLVGEKGSSAWSAGNYGTKIKKALELQTKGAPIAIVKERDFFAATVGDRTQEEELKR